MTTNIFSLFFAFSLFLGGCASSLVEKVGEYKLKDGRTVEVWKSQSSTVATEGFGLDAYAYDGNESKKVASHTVGGQTVLHGTLNGLGEGVAIGAGLGILGAGVKGAEIGGTEFIVPPGF